MPPGAPRAAVVLSGNELLDGRTRDTNGAFVCDDLSRRGVKVTELLTVADDRERLIAALRHALGGDPDLLVIGGGLGTTHDDLTAECLAEVLGVPLEEDADALAFVEERARAVAERRHLDFRETFALARRQARLPAGSTAVPPAGVAPGIAARAGQTRIFAYPGVPYEFQQMWAETAAALERDGFFPDVAVRVVRVFGVGELQVGPVLDALPHDRVELGINVGGGEVIVRVRYRRDDRSAGAGRRTRGGARGRRARLLHGRPHRGRHRRRASSAAAGSRSPSPNPAREGCSARASPRGPAAPTTSSAA